MITSHRVRVGLAMVSFLLTACGGSSATPDAGDGSRPSMDAAVDDASPPSTDAAVDDSSRPTRVSTACAEPTQGPIGADWPEVFVGTTGCDDAGAGTRDVPFCSFGAAFDATPSAPAIVTVLEGEYRLFQADATDFRLNLRRPGSADAYYVIRADAGATPTLLGSLPFAGASFEESSPGVFRVDISGFPRDPAGLWTSEGRRIDHKNGDFNIRAETYHVDVSALSAGEWTKADASGTACPNDNAGCFIYVKSPADLDVASSDFEVEVGGFFSATGSDYMVLRGLRVLFTHWTPVFFSNSDYVLVEDNEFAHNAAQGGNNAYGLSLWYANGAIVRRNRVTDTHYWTTANGHGVTFMVSGDELDNWVCDNDISDVTRAGVSSKDGVSNLHVIGNRISDAGMACVQISNQRMQDGTLYGGGGYSISENTLSNCMNGVSINFLRDGDMVLPSRVFNNVMVDVRGGVRVTERDPLTTLRNNIYLRAEAGIELWTSGDPSDLVGRNVDSDYSFFAGSLPAYARFEGGRARATFSLSDARSMFGAEAASLEGDARLDPASYAPLSDSPVKGAGDPSMYPDHTGPVNMGRVPFD